MAFATGHGMELAGVPSGEVDKGPAIVAVRPEDFVVGEPPTGETNRMEVSIEVVEYHGRELSVQARLPQGQALLLRTPARVSRGDTVAVFVPRDRVLVFPGGGATDAPSAGPPSPRPAGTAMPGGARGAEHDREHEVTRS
jgi:hypothetical protein